MNQTPEISIEDVTFRYQTQPTDELAVESLNCAIEEGEFVGITGEAGAGKTTFCRLLAGHIPHFYDGYHEGRTHIQGTDTREVTIGELAETVGYVFENPYDQLTGSSLTVEEEIAFALENMGVPRPEMKRRIRESLSTVNIGHLIDRDPYQLSGGQCQRVAIASVLAMETDILVLQNPTSQLDPIGTEEVLNAIRNLNDSGYTIVISTQNIEQVAPLLDRLLVLSDGEIVENGSPRAVLNSSIEKNHPIMVPDVVRLGKRLREGNIIDKNEKLPLTLQQGIEELENAYRIDTEFATETVRELMVESTSSPRASISGENAEPKLKIDDVSHVYDGTVQALNDINIEFYGGCTCILGQNGAGKSTLIKLFNGLLSPTEGDVYVYGESTNGKTIADLSKTVGLSFQDPNNQLFNSSVEKEIRYGPKNLDYDQDRIAELTDSAIELLELDEVRESNPHELSLAWKKRVTVASVVAMDTPIVVLDEPTGGQDKFGQRVIGKTISQLVRDGKLVIVVTHDPTFAANYADRTLVLSDGELILDGSPGDVLTSEVALREANVTPPAITKFTEIIGETDAILQGKQ